MNRRYDDQQAIHQVEGSILGIESNTFVPMSRMQQDGAKTFARTPKYWKYHLVASQISSSLEDDSTICDLPAYLTQPNLT